MRIRISVSGYDYNSIIAWARKSLEKKNKHRFLFCVARCFLYNLKKIPDGTKEFIILKSSSVKKVNQKILGKVNKGIIKIGLSAYLDDLTIIKNGTSLVFDATIANLKLRETFAFLAEKFDENETPLVHEVVAPVFSALSGFFARVMNEFSCDNEKLDQYQDEFFTEIFSASASGLKKILPEFIKEKTGIILNIDEILIDKTL